MKRLPLCLALTLVISAAWGQQRELFDLMGHRGSRGLAPDNTLAAFRAGIEAGVTTIEMDIGMTKDGQLVVTHEQHLSAEFVRNANGQWLEKDGPPISSLTYAELKTYDVGRFRPKSPHYQRYLTYKPVDGERIPLLSEVFDLVNQPKNRHVRLCIETKLIPADSTARVEEMTRKLVDQIVASKLSHRTSIASFDWRSLRQIQTTQPSIETVYLTAQQPWLDNVQGKDAGKPSPWTGVALAQYDMSIPKMIKGLGGKTWSPFVLEIDDASVREAKAAGLKIIPWTVNDPNLLRRVVRWGVDGVITDRPDVLRVILEFDLEKQLRWPSQ